MAGDPGDDVVVGVVGKPFGLRGEVYVHPDPDIQPALSPGETYRLPDGGTVTVVRSSRHGGRTVVAFEGILDREGAERLRGERLLTARSQIPTGPDVFWTSDVLGLEAVDPEGMVVGVVEAIRDGVAHDYLVIARPDGGELLVPAVEALVEITEDQIVVRLVEGL